MDNGDKPAEAGPTGRRLDKDLKQSERGSPQPMHRHPLTPSPDTANAVTNGPTDVPAANGAVDGGVPVKPHPDPGTDSPAKTDGPDPAKTAAAYYAALPSADLLAEHGRLQDAFAQLFVERAIQAAPAAAKTAAVAAEKPGADAAQLERLAGVIGYDAALAATGDPAAEAALGRAKVAGLVAEAVQAADDAAEFMRAMRAEAKTANMMADPLATSPEPAAPPAAPSLGEQAGMAGQAVADKLKTPAGAAMGGGAAVLTALLAMKMAGRRKQKQKLAAARKKASDDQMPPAATPAEMVAEGAEGDDPVEAEGGGEMDEADAEAMLLEALQNATPEDLGALPPEVQMALVQALQQGGMPEGVPGGMPEEAAAAALPPDVKTAAAPQRRLKQAKTTGTLAELLNRGKGKR